MHLNPKRDYKVSDPERLVVVRGIIEQLQDAESMWYTSKACADMAIKFLDYVVEHFPDIDMPLLWPQEEYSFNFAFELPLSRLYVCAYANDPNEDQEDKSLPAYTIMEMSNNPDHLRDPRCANEEFPEELWSTFGERIKNPKCFGTCEVLHQGNNSQSQTSSRA